VPDDQRLGRVDELDVVVRQRAQRPVELVQPPQPDRERDSAQQLGGGHDGGGLDEAVAVEHPVPDREIFADRLVRGRHQAGHVELGARGAVDQPTGDHRHRRLRGPPDAELDLELARQPLVVVVEERGPHGPGVGDPGVARVRRATPLRQLNNPQSLVGKGGERLAGLLVGTVDHDDDLDALDRLRERAANGAGDQRRPAEGGDHHADVGCERHRERTLWSPDGHRVKSRWPEAVHLASAASRRVTSCLVRPKCHINVGAVAHRDEGTYPVRHDDGHGAT
jgi:hypothetical protein